VRLRHQVLKNHRRDRMCCNDFQLLETASQGEGEMLTFGLRTPRDLLEKLKRDGTLLDDEVTSDRFFNFVITGYSLIDWLKHEPTVARSDVEAMYQDQWIKICGDIANASKHFSLTTRTPIASKVNSQQGFGVGRFGKGGFGVGEEGIVIELNDGSSFSCLELVRKVIETWEEFFRVHAL
jgi:hypothetical protein